MKKNNLVGTLTKNIKPSNTIKFGALLFLILLILFLVFQSGLTGLSILNEEKEYFLYEEKNFNNSSSFKFIPETQGELIYLSISGEIENKGKVEIKINNLTILNSTKMPTNKMEIDISKNNQDVIENETQIKELKNTTHSKKEIIFNEYCLETCNINNLKKESYEIKINIENSSLKIKEIKYKIKNIKEINKKITQIKEKEHQTTHEQIKVDKNVKWTKNIQTNKSQIKIQLPKEAENISVKKESTDQKTKNPSKEINANYFISTNKNQNSLELTIEDNSQKYKIYYETPSPKKIEKKISETKKIVTISAPDSLNYTNILATTQIKEIAKTKQDIKVYWIEGSKEIDFDIKDSNSNGIIDTITWTVPHLSDQTFEITIEQVQSQNLTPTKTGDSFNQWDLPENAYASDNLYTQENRNFQSQDWYDFNFNIPLTATIQGIEISVEGQDPTWANQGVEIKLSGDNGETYTLSKTTTWPNSQDQINKIGNQTFLWGKEWIPQEFLNENFKIKLTKIGNDWNRIKIDQISAKVFYQESQEPIKIILISPEKEYTSIYIPNFEFQVINDQKNSTNCSLLLNSETQSYSFQTIAENSTKTIIKPSNLEHQNYTWEIKCFDINETFFSRKRNFNYPKISPTKPEENSPSQYGKIFNQWYLPENAYISDNLYTQENRNFQSQDWYDFNFSISNNSIIKGIEIQIEGRDPTYRNQKILTQISGDNGTSFTEPMNIVLSGIESINTIGNSTFLWNKTWTKENFSNQNFIIKLTKMGRDYNYIYVNNIKVIIYTQEFLPEPPKIQIYKNLITDVSSGLNEGPLDTNITIKFQIITEEKNKFLNSIPKITLLKNEEERKEKNCQLLNNETTTNSMNYTCTISMNFWDSPGNWQINTSIKDSLNNYYENATETLYIGATSGFITSQSKVNWDNILPGEKNLLARNSLILKNTGNTEKNISVLAYDLLGETNSLIKIPANQFSISTQPNCNGTIQENSTEKKIKDAILLKGNSFLNDSQGKEELYFCIIQSPPYLTNQNYSTQKNREWFIKIF